MVQSKLQQITNGVHEPSTLIVAFTTLVIHTASYFHSTDPHRQTTSRYFNKSRGPQHITPTPILVNGLVGLYIIYWRDGSAQEGVFRYPKCCSNQSRPRGIKLFLILLHTFKNNLMNNQDLKFSAPPKDYTNIGTILGPKLRTQDHKQVQTPVDTTTGLLHNPRYGKVIIPK